MYIFLFWSFLERSYASQSKYSLIQQKTEKSNGLSKNSVSTINNVNPLNHMAARWLGDIDIYMISVKMKVILVLLLLRGRSIFARIWLERLQCWESSRIWLLRDAGGMTWRWNVKIRFDFYTSLRSRSFWFQIHLMWCLIPLKLYPL